MAFFAPAGSAGPGRSDVLQVQPLLVVVGLVGALGANGSRVEVEGAVHLDWPLNLSEREL